MPFARSPLLQACLHLCVTISICANLMCTASTTFVSVWGSGKALRGKDGSMDEAVDGMHNERAFIFSCFGVGLITTLLALMSAAWILMTLEVACVATLGISWCIYVIVRQGAPRRQLDAVPRLGSLSCAHPPPCARATSARLPAAALAHIILLARHLPLPVRSAAHPRQIRPLCERRHHIQRHPTVTRCAARRARGGGGRGRGAHTQREHGRAGAPRRVRRVAPRAMAPLALFSLSRVVGGCAARMCKAAVDVERIRGGETTRAAALGRTFVSDTRQATGKETVSTYMRKHTSELL